MLQQVTADTTKIDSFPVLVIQTDDILNIKVSSKNPETVIAFQALIKETPNAAAGEAALGVQEGYRVDEDGNIYMPFLGAVQAAGKSIPALRQEITDKLARYIPDAAVQIRFLSFRVTLMGEVMRPNTYIIPNERLNLLEAVSMAGDFTPYAKRNAVLLIRQRNDVREMVRINTQSPELFTSPYFYLSPNDMVYVEPLKAKQYATQGDFLSRYGTAMIPIVGLLTFILGTFAQ